MARPAISFAEHELKGTTRRAADETVPASRPKLPRGFSPEQRKLFRRLCVFLSRRRHLTEGDAEVLRIYCDLWEHQRQAQEEIKERGLFCDETRTDSNGAAYTVRRTNLAYDVHKATTSQMVGILARLGLDPKSRASVKQTATAVREEEKCKDLLLK